MSIRVTNLVRAKSLGGKPTLKSVLVACAERASDDGTEVYASKATFCRELEMSERTVRKAFADLARLGLIVCKGKRPCARGYTKDYSLDLDRIEALPTISPGRLKVVLVEEEGVHVVQATGAPAAPLGVHVVQGRGAPAAPKPSFNLPTEPSTESKGDCSRARAITEKEENAESEGGFSPDAAALFHQRILTLLFEVAPTEGKWFGARERRVTADWYRRLLAPDLLGAERIFMNDLLTHTRERMAYGAAIMTFRYYEGWFAEWAADHSIAKPQRDAGGNHHGR